MNHMEKLLELPHGEEIGARSVYGRGLYVVQRGEYRIAHHTGGIDGFLADFVKIEHPDPSRSFTLFVSSNNGDSDFFKQLANEVAAIWAGEKIFGQREPPPQPPAVKTTQHKDELARLEGKYYCSMLKTDHTLEAVQKEDHWLLKMKADGAEEKFSMHFVPLQGQDNSFIEILDDGEIYSATLQFLENGNCVLNDPPLAIKDLALTKRT